MSKLVWYVRFGKWLYSAWPKIRAWWLKEEQ